jgi:hypothetical protein
VATLPLGLLSWEGALPAAAALTFLVALAVIDLILAHPPLHVRSRRFRFRLGVVTMQLVQPVVRTWSRWRVGAEARRGNANGHWLPAPVSTGSSGTVLYPATTTRAEFAAAVVGILRASGLRVSPVTGWEDHDGLIPASALVEAVIVTSAFPEGCMQLRIRRRPRWRRVAACAVLIACVGVAAPLLAAVGALAAFADLSIGFARTGRRLQRHLITAGVADVVGDVALAEVTV